jgi:hypothetical protein
MLTRYRLLILTRAVDQCGIPRDDAITHWTPAERMHLADLMIAQWLAFKRAGAQPVDHAADLSARLAR